MAFDTGSGINGNGTGKTSSASMTHSANAWLLVYVSYLGTTSPTVDVAGTNLSSFDKRSQGSNNTGEFFRIFRVNSATETVTVTFGSNTRHSFAGGAWTGSSNSTSIFQGLTGATGSGASPANATASIAAGTNPRIVVAGSAFSTTGNANATFGIAAHGTETERAEGEQAGSSSTKPAGSQLEDKSDAGAGGAVGTDGTISAGTPSWAIGVVALLPFTTTSNTISGNARLKATTSRTQSGNARLKTTQSKTVAGNARLKTTQSKTIAGNARLKATQSRTISGNARLLTTQTRIIVGDAALITAVETHTQTIEGNARLKTTSPQSIVGDARLKTTQSPTITGNARLKTTQNPPDNPESSLQTITGNAALKSTIQPDTGPSLEVRKLLRQGEKEKPKKKKPTSQIAPQSFTVTGTVRNRVTLQHEIAGQIAHRTIYESPVTGYVGFLFEHEIKGEVANSDYQELYVHGKVAHQTKQVYDVHGTVRNENQITYLIHGEVKKQ